MNTAFDGTGVDILFFFFQAEDGIRDYKVTGVQTCALPVADWLARLPTLWIEGEVTELRRNANWASVFFTLKDPDEGACLPASIPRRTFDALKLELAEGERIHELCSPELFAAKGEFRAQK